ncbi:AMEP412 family response elicitor [Priestia taiwanensis]|uniref:Uncharacterized protein n=1 Tax=Priestia taiwanensis TaxID=1347902 RepID=A0A917AX61_9BACI|nr:AMEP412 family response elicitor [Priestia taiwanensis]MBM7365064.1 hypothetical protein [Priestia taiwanensis]GGE83794.1 hypothetical protein GCM10007140_36630 [Priestia taiwanensis]
MAAILNALKALVSKIPFHKVPQFLAWAANLAKAAASKTAAEVTKILNFIKSNGGKIVDWFSKGYTVYEIIRMILGY